MVVFWNNISPIDGMNSWIMDVSHENLFVIYNYPTFSEMRIPVGLVMDVSSLLKERIENLCCLWSGNCFVTVIGS